MTNGMDHDVVVRLEAKASYICKEIETIKRDVKEIKATCSCRMSDCKDNFTSNKLFQWTIGILIFVVLSFGSITTVNRVDVSKIDTELKVLNEKIHFLYK